MSKSSLTPKSVSLKSYAMFKPSVPNFRRSSNNAWKNDNANNSRPYLLLLEHCAKDSSETHVVYNRARLARSPFGGSVVIFKPRCKIANGKAGVGFDDNHNLKFSCGGSFSKFSMMHWSSGNQDIIKWQFARNTQWPSFRPRVINSVATEACPCPSATVKSLSLIPLFTASCFRFATGSTPALRTKMEGAVLVESKYT